MAKKNNNYYNMFSDIANDAIFAAHHLEKTVKNYNPEKMEKLNKTMHEIEHGADLKKHQMMKKTKRSLLKKARKNKCQ